MSRHVILGAGPVAHAIVASLTQRGIEVDVLSRSGTKIHGARTVTANVLDTENLKSVISGCDAVYQARHEPVIAELARQRNDEAARTLAADIKDATPTPLETARLLVAATIEVAIQELTSGRRLPRLRTALLAMVPEGDSSVSASGR